MTGFSEWVWETEGVKIEGGLKWLSLFSDLSKGVDVIIKMYPGQVFRPRTYQGIWTSKLSKSEPHGTSHDSSSLGQKPRGGGRTRTLSVSPALTQVLHVSYGDQKAGSRADSWSWV